MFRIAKSFRFEAAHCLPLHDGVCKRRHGHGYVVTLFLEGESLVKHGPKSGMLCDFGDVKAAFANILRDNLDHHDLNETVPVSHTTSEMLAQWIYERLKPELPLLARVRVSETESTWAEYEP